MGGACMSVPQAAGGAPVRPEPSNLRQPSVDCNAFVTEGPAAGGAARRIGSGLQQHPPPPEPGGGDGGASDTPLGALLQVQGLQNALAAVSEAPGLGLSEAAELLQQELGVAHVSIYGFCSPESGPCPAAVLLAAFGSGVARLERQPLVTSGDWSVMRMRAGGLDSLHAREGEEEHEKLPADWRLLHQDAGLSCFRAVPIGPAAKPWGALVVAASDRESLDGLRWRVWPSVAAVALVHQVRHWQIAATCALVRQLAGEEGQITFIGVLLQGARAFMDRATNMRTGMRLAVLDEALERALVFELAAPGAKGVSDDGSVRGDGPPLVASEMGLSNTLLASAVALKKARFVRDCTSYMQSSAAPARDLFTQPTVLVSSLVVVPLVHGSEEPRAALYLTLEAPNDFAAAQAPLLGFVNSVLPLLHQRLSADLAAIWEEARAVRDHSNRLRTARRRSISSCGAAAPGSATAAVAAAAAARAAFGHAHPPPARTASGRSAYGRPSSDGSDGYTEDSDQITIGDAPSSQLANCATKRLCTEGMVKALEQEIIKCKRLSVDQGPQSFHSNSRLELSISGSGPSLPPVCADLVLHEVIGSGGFGVVWRGAWKNVTAAIKVMYQRSTEQEAMKDAVEMAVLSTVNHPNVVQVFACLTDMVEEAAVCGMSGSKSSGALMRACLSGPGTSKSAPLPRLQAQCYRPLAPFEDPEDTDTCNIIVMEYCDMGTLRENLHAGLFHQPLEPADGNPTSGPSGGPGGGGPGPIAVDMAALLRVALEIAEAVSYMHSIRLCHCDIKLDNVLLKGAPAQPCGYISKLADFGLVKVLGAANAAINVNGAGTVSHLAPELFQAGSVITTAADTYAFGILLYELYMGGAHAYAGLRKSAIMERVARAGMRPRFPRGVPQPYRDLASACWSEHPSQRPPFSAIIAALRRLQEQMDPAGSEEEGAEPPARPDAPPRRPDGVAQQQQQQQQAKHQQAQLLQQQAQQLLQQQHYGAPPQQPPHQQQQQPPPPPKQQQQQQQQRHNGVHAMAQRFDAQQQQQQQQQQQRYNAPPPPLRHPHAPTPPTPTRAVAAPAPAAPAPAAHPWG